MSGSVVVVEGALHSAIEASVFNDATGGIFVAAGSTTEIAGHFINGSQAGNETGNVSLGRGAQLTIFDTTVEATGQGGYFLASSSDLVLQFGAELVNQSVVFESGATNATVDFDQSQLSTGSPLAGSFFGFASSDRIVLPFDIGAISYNGQNGFLSLSDTSGHSAGAEFYVGSGYNGGLFGGVGTTTLTYGGADTGASLTYR